MASFLFTCVSCLGLRRVVGVATEPAEFDFICDECKGLVSAEEEAPEAEAEEEAPEKPARGRPRRQ